jgi:hypothetical protein
MLDAQVPQCVSNCPAKCHQQIARKRQKINKNLLLDYMTNNFRDLSNLQCSCGLS